MHRVVAFSASEILRMLRQAGLRGRVVRRYGNFRVPSGILVAIARKA